MKALVDQKPIIACSSGMGSNNAISVIRLSGFKNLSILQPFFSFKLDFLEPRKAIFTELIFDEKKYDEVVLVYYKAPNSYNGENILEISVHGNKLNVRRILNLFLDNLDIRTAEPGEFTYRAFLNKKMSLSQVEGLDLFLNSQTPLSLDQGLSLLNGELSQAYQELYNSFLTLKGAVELGIDFLDDIGDEASKRHLLKSLSDFETRITQLYKRVQGDNSNLLTPTVAIFGPPNAGKSSLFNHLLSFDRAIVSSIPGTTRDYLSEFLVCGDDQFRLIDTAGIRESLEAIEREGISRALRLVEGAFFKILVLNPFDFDENSNFLKNQNINFDLVIITHIDKKHFDNALVQYKDFLPAVPIYFMNLSGPIGPVKKGGPIGPERKCGPIGPADLGSGPIEPVYPGELRYLIQEKYLQLTEINPILIERHRDKIKVVYTQVCHFNNLLATESDIAIISHEINMLEIHLSELIGIISPDEVLTSIFSNFCIGK